MTFFFGPLDCNGDYELQRDYVISLQKKINAKQKLYKINIFPAQFKTIIKIFAEIKLS